LSGRCCVGRRILFKEIDMMKNELKNRREGGEEMRVYVGRDESICRKRRRWW
jgi:hypothetical protein